MNTAWASGSASIGSTGRVGYGMLLRIIATIHIMAATTGRRMSNSIRFLIPNHLHLACLTSKPVLKAMANHHSSCTTTSPSHDYYEFRPI